jgi:hypothetical protein
MSIFNQVLKQIPCKWKMHQLGMFTNPFLLASWQNKRTLMELVLERTKKLERNSF